MRDVAYSPTDSYTPAQSHDYGSPVPMSAASLGDVAVPLDPMLAPPSQAPSYFPPPNGVNGHVSYQVCGLSTRCCIDSLTFDASRRVRWGELVFRRCRVFWTYADYSSTLIERRTVSPSTCSIYLLPVAMVRARSAGRSVCATAPSTSLFWT